MRPAQSGMMEEWQRTKCVHCCRGMLCFRGLVTEHCREPPTSVAIHGCDQHRGVADVPDPGDSRCCEVSFTWKPPSTYPLVITRISTTTILSSRPCGRACLALSLVAAVASLEASELVMADLNLGIESLPTAFDFTIRDGASTRSGSSEFDLGFGLGGRVVYAFSAPGASGAFFVGGGVALGGYRFENDGTYDVAMARAMVGYAFSIDDQWTVEVSPWAGLGLGRMHIPGAGVSNDHDVDGQVVDYGVHLGVTYALSRSWLVGARVGWQVVEADLKGDGLEVELTQSGPSAFLGIVYRFGGAPPSIR